MHNYEYTPPSPPPLPSAPGGGNLEERNAGVHLQHGRSRCAFPFYRVLHQGQHTVCILVIPFPFLPSHNVYRLFQSYIQYHPHLSRFHLSIMHIFDLLVLLDGLTVAGRFGLLC